MKFLYAAFAATWVIHIVYLVILSRSYARVRDEIKELDE
jgi:CcmD family protein